MNMKKEYKTWVLLFLFIVLGVISFFVLGKKFSDVRTYTGIFEILDEKKANVMGLTASLTATANAISFIPGDGGMPLANQFTELSSWLVLVLVVLYLEKYLLTTIGYLVFRILVPLAMLGFGLNLFIRSRAIGKMLMKMLTLGAVLMLLVPASTGITKMIDDTYEESKQIDVEEIFNADVEEEIEEEITVEENKEDLKWYEKITDFFSDLAGTAKEKAEDFTEGLTNGSKSLIEKAKKALDDFVEATVVMIVTSCVVPLMTLLLLLALMKILLNVDIGVPRINMKGTLIKNHLNTETGEDPV